MTAQERMKAKLEESGITNRKIEVYGRQIVVTAASRKVADKWVGLLDLFCRKVRGPVRCLDQAKINRGTVLRPTMIRVWRIGGTV